jgi:hypothetical protein
MPIRINSTDPNNAIGRLVQDYADRSYKTGFIRGVCLGVILGIGFSAAATALLRF